MGSVAVLETEEILEEMPTVRLDKDLMQAARELKDYEVRYLVDSYYAIQEYRKAAGNQIRACEEIAEPSSLLRWWHEHARAIEGQIKRALDAYTDEAPAAAWAKSICGIGPVIAAGLSAHIDITQAPTAGHIWSFAGLDPTKEWAKGEKRPWNAKLKTLTWKIGQSFMKVSGNTKDVYGKLYRQRKEEEQARNERQEFAEQAADKLRKYNIGKKTEAFKHYSKGFLPPAHIDARARRWAVKLFLAHYHHVAYELHFGEPPPKPYILVYGNVEHVHYVGPPNWPME